MLIHGTHSLTLYRPGPPDPSPIEVPDGLPLRFPDAGLLLNHGLLAADLLGLDTREAQEVVDSVGGMPESVLAAYDDEDAAALAALFEKLIAALDQAVDASGFPHGPLGERLAGSPLMTRASAGALLFVSHKLPVADLRSELPILQRMLAFAAKEGLWLRIE
jgi:hypothetical protein